ncbi:MAG: tubulin-like doman-containing protein [Candidatus Bipolaricaulota bacterium]
MNIEFDSTVIVGIGGMGVKTLLSIKAKLIERFGEVPEEIEIRGFDTWNSNRSNYAKVGGKPITLTEAEFTQVWVPFDRVREFIKRCEEVQNWFPSESYGSLPLPEDPLQSKPPFRYWGRLALFYNADKIYDSIKKACSSVVSADSPTHKSFKDSPNKNGPSELYLVTSLAGGTGSGMFLDVGHMCRKIAGEYTTTFGMLALAEIFTERANTEFVKPNTYGALKELNHLLKLGQKEDDEIKVEYPGNLGKISWGSSRRSLDNLFVIDNKMADDFQMESISSMVEILSRGIMLNILRLNEPFRWTHGLDFSWRKVNPPYSSLGYSGLKLPIDQTIEANTQEATYKLINGELLSSDRSGAQENASEFLKNHNLGVESLPDDLISSRKSIEVQPKKRPEEADNVTLAVENWKDNELSRIEDEFSAIASSNYENKLEVVKEVIEKKVSTNVNERGNIDYAVSLTHTLLNQLRANRDKIDANLAEVKKERESIEYPKQELQDAESKWLFGKSAIRSVYEQYLANIRNEDNEAIRDEIRLEQASEFLKELIKLTQDLNERVESVQDTLYDCVNEVDKQRSEVMAASSNWEDVFTRYLDQDYLRPFVEDIKEEINLSRLLNKVKPLDWADSGIDAILDEVQDLPRERFQKLREVNIITVFEKMEEKTVDEKLKDLVDRSSVHCGNLNIPENEDSLIGEELIFFIPTPESTHSKKIISRIFDEDRAIAEEEETNVTEIFIYKHEKKDCLRC